MYQSDSVQQYDLPDYIEDLASYLSINKEVSDTPDTLLWSVTSPVNAASGTASGYSDNKLGKPKSFSKWFALVRLWSPWLAPRQGKGEFKPDKDAILASFLRHDGSHVVVLAISGIDDVLTCLHHDGEGGIVMNSRNDSEKEGIARLIVAVGSSFETANAAAMYHARKLVMRYQEASGEEDAELKALAEGFKPQWLENWYDGLTYCTWNGIGQHLTEDKLFEALDSLAKNDINSKAFVLAPHASFC